MTRLARPSSRPCGRLVLLILLAAGGRLSGQSIDVTTGADALQITAPGFAFIEGQVLSRLRDGRSVRLELALMVLAREGGRAVAERRQIFDVSFDLWEERFAVTRVGTPARTVSHLTSRAAEAWCIENLTVPLRELGRLGRDAPLWIRLAYRVHTPDVDSRAASGVASTLERLIDLLGRRRVAGDLEKSMEAGPFRLPE